MNGGGAAGLSPPPPAAGSFYTKLQSPVGRVPPPFRPGRAVAAPQQKSALPHSLPAPLRYDANQMRLQSHRKKAF